MAFCLMTARQMLVGHGATWMGDFAVLNYMYRGYEIELCPNPDSRQQVFSVVTDYGDEWPSSCPELFQIETTLKAIDQDIEFCQSAEMEYVRKHRPYRSITDDFQPSW